ncbi:maleylpyruvate isomerase family mycothiol-dependent enzyme [Streptomyces sp. NBC_01500]|uniref:maleylpyruvate isomerase family mycothiol-dependent enzyme n=1 Tax=Streptomyces sp. NBC_01500 TaxID=2903886 RepID=UPI00224DA5B6|nr:maleylpyruvate isomerase family mycothiol-dependent enzyme [Streptomyces sp. NBC_01500]MCX4551405.1 maleylpyruvate isomerase family mycothiol-dependent enzyme [Streptomyces sp. NBC_01500]
MTLLDHDRYCDELVRETALLRAVLTDADLTATVPTCPEWSLGELVRHVGRAHRWAEVIVRTKASEAVPDDQVPDSAGPGDTEPAALGAWLAAGAERLVATLRAAGPDVEVWSWAGEQHSGFWARRMVHETVIHRADAALATGVAFEVDAEVAGDTIEEWLEIVAFAAASGDPHAVELRGAGRSLHLHATDVPDAEWLIELTEDGFEWRRAHEKATVAVRGPLADVLLVFYRRLPADSDRVEVLGDTELLDFWLERASFG